MMTETTIPNAAIIPVRPTVTLAAVKDFANLKRRVIAMRIHKRFFMLMAPGLVLSIAVEAKAQSAEIAATLFQRARSQMEANDFTAACPLLDESYRQDPKLGTLFTLANCRDREGRLATARVRYSEYMRGVDNLEVAAERNRHADRRTIAQERVKVLEKEVPKLKLVWQGGFPEDVRIRIDDIAVATVALSVALPFDPGKHVVMVQRAGYTDYRQEVALEKGSQLSVDVSTWPLVKSPTAVNGHGTTLDKDTAQTSRLPLRKTGYALLGLGGAGLVLGTVMGALTLGEKSKVNEHCHGPQGYDCDTTGFAAVANMRLYATPSTIGFIAGGVLAAAGASFVIFAPTMDKSIAMRLHVRGAAGQGFVGIEGAF